MITDIKISKNRILFYANNMIKCYIIKITLKRLTEEWLRGKLVSKISVPKIY